MRNSFVHKLCGLVPSLLKSTVKRCCCPPAMLYHSVIVMQANSVLVPGPPYAGMTLNISPKKCYTQQFVISVEFAEF